MRKKIWALFAISILCFSLFFIVNAEDNPDSDHTIIRNHLIEHTGIPAEIAAQMVISYDADEEYYCVSYFDFSYAFLTIDLLEDGSVYYCNCDDHKGTDIALYNEYFYAMLSSLPTTGLWEEIYGPHELWNAEQNAAFYEKFGFLPKADQYSFAFSPGNPCIYPEEKHITLKTACEKADTILLSHFLLTPDELLNLKKGTSLFRATDSDTYYIEYYKLTKNNEPEKQYWISLDAQSGVCIHANRVYLLPGEITPGLDSYWSEIYEFQRQEDGSYMRVKKVR